VSFQRVYQNAWKFWKKNWENKANASK